MKVLELKIDDSIFDNLKGILELIPGNKIKIKELYDDSHIPHVSDKEQTDIETRLKKKSCRVTCRSKTIKL